jgi:hypothetical protein
MNATHKIAVALGRAAAVTSAIAWMALVLLSGTLIPRVTLVAAAMAIALAVAAYRAVQSDQHWVLLVAATFGTLTPPDLGNAPAAFKYVGVLALGYAMAAILLLAARRDHRRAR